MRHIVVTANLHISSSTSGEQWKTLIREQVAHAAADLADLIVLPETLWLPVSGTTIPRNDDEADAFRNDWIPFLGALAKEHDLYILAGTLPEYVSGAATYLTSYLFDKNGLIVGRQRKLSLSAEDISTGFSPGDELRVFDTAFGVSGVLVGDDSRVPEYARILRLMGADILLNPFSPQNPLTDLEDYHGARVRCQENQTYGVQSGLVGEFHARRFHGHSIIIAPTQLTQFRDGFLREYDPIAHCLSADLDLEALRKLRSNFDLVKNINIDVLRKYSEHLL